MGGTAIFAGSGLRDEYMNAYRVTAATVTTIANSFYVCDCSSNAIAVTLPVGVSAQGTMVIVKRADVTYSSAVAVTFSAQASQSLFDSISLTLNGQAVTWVYDGNGTTGTWNVA